MSDTSGKKNLVVLACSGASNMGQISNAVAVNMQKEGIAEMICMTAVGAGQSSHTGKVKAADEVIIINGCKKACSTKIVENLGIQNQRNYIIQKLLPDLEKGKDYSQVGKYADKLRNEII